MAARDSRLDATEGNHQHFPRPSLVLLAGIAGMVLTLAGCGDAPMAPSPGVSSGGSTARAASGGFDSPQAAFEAKKKAKIDEDAGAGYDVYDPESRKLMVSQLAYTAAVQRPDEPRADKLIALLKKHGSPKQ